MSKICFGQMGEQIAVITQQAQTGLFVRVREGNVILFSAALLQSNQRLLVVVLVSSD